MGTVKMALISKKKPPSLAQRNFLSLGSVLHEITRQQLNQQEQQRYQQQLNQQLRYQE